MSRPLSEWRADDCRPVPADPELSTLERIVNHYLRTHRPRVIKERKFYADQRSLEAAVDVAACARTEGDKRHSHQRRIREAVLRESRARLLYVTGELQACQSFEELFHLVEAVIGPIDGIGELAIYDTALRLGAYLNLAPELVYIHSGTRTGLKHLGLYHGQAAIDPARFPEPLRRLEPHEIEDCLCIYKDNLQPQSPLRSRPQTVTTPAPAPAPEITGFTPAEGTRSQRLKRIMDLGRLRTPTAIHTLAASLGDKDANVRWLAGSHLIRFGGRDSVDTLAAYLASDPPAIGRAEALRVLGLIADADEDEAVREMAASLLK